MSLLILTFPAVAGPQDVLDGPSDGQQEIYEYAGYMVNLMSYLDPLLQALVLPPVVMLEDVVDKDLQIVVDPVNSLKNNFLKTP